MALSRRQTLRLFGSSVVALAGCNGFDDTGPATGTIRCEDRTNQANARGSLTGGGDDWPSEQYDTGNTGHNPVATGVPGECARVRWRYSVPWEPELSNNDIDGAPSIADGTVYVSARDTIRALDLSTGTEEFEVSLPGVALTTPTIRDGIAFVGRTGSVIAVDIEERRIHWEFAVEDAYPESRFRGNRVETAPRVAAGTVYFGTSGGVLHAVDVESGSEIWSVATPLPRPGERVSGDNSRQFHGASAISHGTVYAGNTNGLIYAIDAETGEIDWQQETEASIEDPPTIVNDVLVVTTEISVLAFDARTGERRWRYKEEPGSAEQSAAIADGTLFVGAGPASESLSLTAIDARDGTRLWKAGTRPNTSPSVANGTVYVGMGGNLVAVDAASGTIKWELETEAVLNGTPAITDEAVITADDDGNVFGIGPT